MRFPAVGVVAALAVVVVVFGLASALGCSTVERVGRPPSSAELGRINAAAQRGRSLVVDYAPVEPICAAANCPPRVVAPSPTSVHSVDERALTLNLASGGRATLPLDAVAGLKVTGYGRVRGAAIGAALFTGVEVGVLGLVVLASQHASMPGVPGQAQNCNPRCGGLFAIVTVEAAVLGGIVGAIIGTPRHFMFGDALAPGER